MIAAKAISIVGGAICFCFGLTLKMMEPEAPSAESPAVNDAETADATGTPKEQTDSAVQESEASMVQVE